MSTLSYLIEALENAKHPKRRLDAKIEVAVKGARHQQNGERVLATDPIGHTYEYDPPAYTASIDDALTLVPKDFPWPWNVTMTTAHNSARLIPNHGDSFGVSDSYAKKGYGANLPIAVCIACLKALRARQEEG